MEPRQLIDIIDELGVFLDEIEPYTSGTYRYSILSLFDKLSVTASVSSLFHDTFGNLESSFGKVKNSYNLLVEKTKQYDELRLQFSGIPVSEIEKALIENVQALQSVIEGYEALTHRFFQIAKGGEPVQRLKEEFEMFRTGYNDFILHFQRFVVFLSKKLTVNVRRFNLIGRYDP